MLQTVLFYAFSALLFSSALMVVLSKDAVRSVLSLVVTFLATAGLWLLLRAEFLALILVLVYVGAVMILFLFVIMMLNLEEKPGMVLSRHKFLWMLVALLVVGLLFLVLMPEHWARHVITAGPSYDNVRALGMVLYTQYAYPFELAGVLLLVAMIAAIALAHRGRRMHSKSQRIAEQVAVQKSDRVRLVSMESEKK